jgi:hypothetical protein
MSDLFEEIIERIYQEQDKLDVLERPDRTAADDAPLEGTSVD